MSSIIQQLGLSVLFQTEWNPDDAGVTALPRDQMIDLRRRRVNVSGRRLGGVRLRPPGHQ